MHRKLIKRFIGSFFFVLLVICAVAIYFEGERLTSEHIAPTSKKERAYYQGKHIDNEVPPGLVRSAFGGSEPVFKSEKSRKHIGDSDKNTNNDWGNGKITASATVVLAAITFILAFFTAGLWFTTWRLSKAAQKTSSRQNKDMRESLDISKKSIDITRSQFFAIHRPKIIVHTFENDFDNQRNVTPVLTYVNAGASSATVTMISATIKLADKLNPGIEMKEKSCDVVIKPGEFKTFTLQSGIPENTFIITNMGKGRSQGYTSPSYIYVGKIHYSDNVGIKRETGFYRRFDDSANRWVIIEDPNYEYNY